MNPYPARSPYSEADGTASHTFTDLPHKHAPKPASEAPALNRATRRAILRATGGFAGRCKGCGRRLG